MKRRDFIKVTGTGAAVAAAGGLTPLLEACAGKPKALGRKVIVLAIDGMDPKLVERFVARGALPTFEKFIANNSFVPLGTSLPPQSPVAWSDFITGAGPGVHGIFDFIHRDPQTLAPFLSISRSSPPSRTMKLGSFVVPLSGGKVENLRRGPCLWDILAQHDVPATVFKCPSNFPPVETDARTVSGMGTPDIRGTYGTFTYYTDDPPADADKFTGGECVTVRLWDNTFTADLTGPPNTFKENAPPAKLRLTVHRDPSRDIAKITWDGGEVVLNRGDWSEWHRVRFKLAGPLADTAGIVRFYLKEVRPHFRLYVTPVNIDPLDPALPISTPGKYAGQIARRAGRYYTQGFPEDTKALSHGVFEEEEYLGQGGIVLAERMACLEETLADFDDGFFYYYFSSIDQNTHMMWRTMDENHPLYQPDASPEVKGAVEHYYREMDGALARVLAKVDDKTAFFIISDHGFAPFYREFNLNTWLLNNGYLTLKDPSRREETEFLDNIDWGRTVAYGFGLNGLYVNIRGREPQGSVEPGDAPALADELAAKLESYTDEETGKRVMVKAYKSRESYRGKAAAEAPELILGFAPGYRLADDSAVAEFPDQVCKVREDKWAGDHCIDPGHVPGVLFTNKPVAAKRPSLRDLAPTILHEFGLDVPGIMTGKPIFK
ncbi:MAG: alkaline phosphatase family protein [Candidatus Zixiibacteriota bacterium]|jgi:predicted AlkP superfamily phosphohydrolase/phosphomutase